MASPVGPFSAARLSSIPGVRVLLVPRARQRILLLLMALAAGQVVVSGLSWIPLRVFGYDFLAYYHAAQRFLDGRPLYDAAMLAGPFPPTGADVFRYPPPMPLFAIPFLALPERVAALVWCSLDIALLAAGCILVVRLVPAANGWPRGRLAWALLGLAFVGQHAVGGEWLVGNVDGPIVLLSVLVLAGVGRRDGRGDALAGVAAGVAAMLKLFPLLLVGWLVWERRWRAAAIAAATLALLAAVAWPWAGFDAWRDFLRTLPNMLPATGNPESASVVATAANVVPAIVAQAGLIVFLVVGLLVQRTSLPRRFALVTLTMLAVSPAAWQHYLVLGFPALWITFATTGSAAIGLGGWFLFWAEPRALPIAGQVLLLGVLILAPAADRDERAPGAPVVPQVAPDPSGAAGQVPAEAHMTRAVQLDGAAGRCAPCTGRHPTRAIRSERL